jgi:hypothetical protein
MLGRHSGIGNQIPRFPGFGGISRFPIPEWPGIGNRETGRFPFGREPGIGVPIRRAGDFLVCARIRHVGPKFQCSKPLVFLQVQEKRWCHRDHTCHKPLRWVAARATQCGTSRRRLSRFAACGQSRGCGVARPRPPVRWLNGAHDGIES